MQARLNGKMPRPLDSLASRLKHARQQRGITQDDLALLAGMKQPDISKIERGLIQQTTGIARLAAALNISAAWLETGDHPEPDFGTVPAKNSPQNRRGLAHELSDSTPRIDSTIVEWGDALDGIHERFSLRVRDDSMEPLLNVGDIAHFRRATEADIKPGGRVLVADRDQNLYIREVKARRPGHWQAAAIKSSAYDPLDSIADGLEIVALLTGVDWA